MSLREEQCNKVCRILDDVLANRPTERDSLIVAVRKAFAEPQIVRVNPDLSKEEFERLVKEMKDTPFVLLPTVEPKRGKWIKDKGQQTLMKNFIERGEVWRVCSVCGAGHMIGHKYATDKAYHERHHNFCPNCGARMEGTDGQTTE